MAALILGLNPHTLKISTKCELQSLRQLRYCFFRFLRIPVNVSQAHMEIFTQNHPDALKYGITSAPSKYSRLDKFSCRMMMQDIEKQELNRLKNRQPFQLPLIARGDLVEVKYELSRTQQTFANFQGYCIDIRHSGPNSSIVLKNTYDGVGIEQRIPLYSPRLLNMHIINDIGTQTKINSEISSTPLTRDYRYKWHHNYRHKFQLGRGSHKPGIKSTEPKIRRRMAKIRRRYMRRRIEAGLPPYIWAGPYPVLGRKRTALIRGDIYRRMLLYSWNQQQIRSYKLRKRRQAAKWGNKKKKSTSAVPSYISELDDTHPLKSGNLPY